MEHFHLNTQKNLGKRNQEVTGAKPCSTSFATFLRNKHPRDTVYWVASGTGANPATVEAWVYEKALPQARHLGPLLAIYGPTILAAIYPNGFGWLDDAIRAERLRELEARRAAIDLEMRQLANDDQGDGS